MSVVENKFTLQNNHGLEQHKHRTWFHPSEENNF